MQYRNLILVIGILVFLHQSEGMFNTGGKNDAGTAWQKSCKSMSKSFDSIAKTAAKVSVSASAVVTLDTFDKKSADITFYIVAIQGWKVVFDLFGSASTSTSSKPNPTELMALINAAYATMTGVGTLLQTSFTNIDGVYKTTFATTAPTPDEQKAFADLVIALFIALTPLAAMKKVTDSDLSAALATVDVAGITKYLADFDAKLMVMDKQMTNLAKQYKQLEDSQKSMKKSVESFTKDLAKFTKATKDSKDKGKKSWNDAADKQHSDLKKNGEKVQKALKANANVDQTTAASTASTKIDAFYEKTSGSVTSNNIVFSSQLSLQYTVSLDQETTFTNMEVLLVKILMTSIVGTMFTNVNTQGVTCLKDMTDQFSTMLKDFQTAQYTCFEDFSTYVAFSTEFINVLMGTFKCQSEAAVNFLPACLKQISKKTSKIYANAMYNTCLGIYSGLLETGYDAGLGATITAMGAQAAADYLFISGTYTACSLDAAAKYLAQFTALTDVYVKCAPPPA